MLSALSTCKGVRKPEFSTIVVVVLITASLNYIVTMTTRTSHSVQGEVTYRCDTCQQTFANRCNLKIHQRHVHSDERLYPCDVCTKTFKRKKDVTRLRRQVRTGLSRGIWDCFCSTFM